MDPQYFNFSNFSNSGVGRGFSYTPSSANEGANSKTPANIGAIGAGMALQSLTSPAASFTSNVGVSSGPGSGITPSISQLGYSAAGTGIAVPSSASGFDPPGASGRASNLATATTSRVGMAGAPDVTALAGATFGTGPSSLTSPRLNSLTSKPLSPFTASFFDTSSENPGNGASSVGLSRVTTPTTTATAPKPFDPSSYYSVQQQRTGGTLKSSSLVSLHSLTSPLPQSAAPQSKPHFSSFGNSAPSTAGGNSTVSFQFKAPFYSAQRQTASSGYDATTWISGGSEASGGGGSHGSLSTPGSSRPGSFSGPSASTYFPNTLQSQHSTLASSQHYANGATTSAGTSTPSMAYRSAVPTPSNSDLEVYTPTATVGGTPSISVVSFAGNDTATVDSVPYSYGATQQQMYTQATPASAGSMTPSYRSNSFSSLQSFNFGANSSGTGYSATDGSLSSSYKYTQRDTSSYSGGQTLQQQQQYSRQQPQKSASSSGGLVSSWAPSSSTSLSSFSPQQYQQQQPQPQPQPQQYQYQQYQQQQQNSQPREEVGTQHQALMQAHMKAQVEYSQALARADAQAQSQAETQAASHAQKQQQQHQQYLQQHQNYQKQREAQPQQHQTTPPISSHSSRLQSQPSRMTASSGAVSFHGDTSTTGNSTSGSSAASVSFTTAPTTASSTLTIPEEDDDTSAEGDSTNRVSIRMMHKNREIEVLQAEVKRLGSLLADRKSGTGGFDSTAATAASSFAGRYAGSLQSMETAADKTPMLPFATLSVASRSDAMIGYALPSPADSESEAGMTFAIGSGSASVSKNDYTFSTDMAFRYMADELNQMNTKNEKLQQSLEVALAKLGAAQISPGQSPGLVGCGDVDELMDRTIGRIVALQEENEILGKLTYQGRAALKEAEVLAIKRENSALRKESSVLQSVAERLRKELEHRLSSSGENGRDASSASEDLPAENNSRRRGAHQEKRLMAAEQTGTARGAKTGVTASFAGLRVSESADSSSSLAPKKKSNVI